MSSIKERIIFKRENYKRKKSIKESLKERKVLKKEKSKQRKV